MLVCVCVCVFYVCAGVCVLCVGVCVVCMCLCVHVYALRIVSTDKILYFINTLIIIIVITINFPPSLQILHQVSDHTGWPMGICLSLEPSLMTPQLPRPSPSTSPYTVLQGFASLLEVLCRWNRSGCKTMKRNRKQT